MNFCKDCKWVEESTEFPRCYHPQSANPVTGDADQMCYIARRAGMCGPVGIFFERKKLTSE